MKRHTALLLIAAALFAQPEKKRLTFEVVSIKPNNSGESSWPIRELNRRVSVLNVQLSVLIAWAYGDPNDLFSFANTEITGLPGWAATARYDVEAQPEAGFIPTAQQRQEMLRSMLEDRFQLKVRRESKDRPIYALVVDSGGIKMKLSVNQTPFSFAPPAPGAPLPAPPPPLPAIAPGASQMRLAGAKMEAIAALLTSGAGRRVVDKTGLTGLYDGELKYYPASPQLPPGGEMDPSIPSLFTALREQLGLRLVPETGSVDTFAVESVQRPSEN
jgi:uncharacterized protein (TIGR03435 family)